VASARPASPVRRPELAVGAVCVHRERLLLVQRAHPPAEGRWTVPGGRVEWGETLAAAVTRELAEETGLRGRCGPLLGFVERIDTDHHFVIFDFAVDLAEERGGEAASDAAALAWVPLGDLSTWPLVPGLLSFLQEVGVVPA
jgi:8-oxo-dGTP diphosphatase